MITVECIDELADYAGIKAEVAAVTERAMRGELDFEAALDARVALLKGLDEAVIDRCHEERVRHHAGRRALVRTMRAHGAYCLLVSGGFSRFADRVAAEIGFDTRDVNELLVDDGKLAGTVGEPIVGAEHEAPGVARRRCRARAGSRSTPRSRSATAPTTFRCWRRPGSASPITPSRRPRPPRTRGSSRTI